MTDPQRTLSSTHKLNERLNVDFALQAAGLGVWEMDPVTNQVIWDERCRQFFGLAKDNLLSYQEAVRYIHPEDVERINQAVILAMNPQSNGVYDQTFRTVGADDGKLRWVRFQGQAYFNESGELYRFAGVAQEITQQILTQEGEAATRHQAQKQQRIYEAITASTPDLIYVFDLSYRFTYANQALLDMWGSTWEKAIGKGLLENGYEPWHAQMHEREIDQVVATKQAIRGEVSFPHATLGKRIYDYVFAPVFNEQGEVEAIAGTTRDITDIKQTQEYLRESERRFRSLVEESPVATCLYVGKDLVVDVANEGMIRFFGRGPAIVGQSIRSILTRSASDGAAISLLEQVFTTGKSYSAQGAPATLTIDGVTGTYFFDLLLKPLRDVTGAVYAVLETATDVTDQVVARRQLAESEGQLKAIIAEAPVAIGLLTGQDLVLQLYNKSFAEMAGKGPDIAGKPIREIMPELADQPYLQLIVDVFRTQQPYRNFAIPAHIVRNGIGYDEFYNVSYVPLLDENGQSYAVLAIALEVTGEVQLRQQAQQTQQSLQQAIELAELGTWILAIETGATELSQRHADMFGFATTILPYEQVLAVVHPDDRERVRAAVLVAQLPDSQGHYQAEYRIINARNGQQQHIRARGETIFDEQGQPVRIVGTTQDVTLERELQLVLENQVYERTKALQLANQDLQRSNDSLQQFAYVASHDLQEPLRKIQSFSTLLAGQLEGQLSESGQDYLQRITSAGARMSTLIKDLLAYSRISTRQQVFGLVSLDTILAQVLSTLDWVIAEREAQIEVAVLPVVKGDELQLSQLFQNLLSNAIKFTPADQAPQIQIQCWSRDRSELPPEVRPTNDAPRFYQISVRDKGIGFDPKYVDRIFQVFQRLHGKAEFPGTGVGLAICEKVALNHGGFITAHSQLGDGATFSVYLPE